MSSRARELERIVAESPSVKVQIEAVRQLGNLGQEGFEALRRIAVNKYVQESIRIHAVKQLGEGDG